RGSDDLPGRDVDGDARPQDRLHAPGNAWARDHGPGRMLPRDPHGRVHPRHRLRRRSRPAGGFGDRRLHGRARRHTGAGMTRTRPEPVQVVKQRRDAALRALVNGVPYIQFLGIGFDRRGDELTALLPFDDRLIGNPLIPALHGGVTAAFLEVTAIIELSWSTIWEDMEGGRLDPSRLDAAHLPRLPKTIDFTVDYLRS